jgi:hypothetical protein
MFVLGLARLVQARSLDGAFFRARVASSHLEIPPRLVSLEALGLILSRRPVALNSPFVEQFDLCRFWTYWLPR